MMIQQTELPWISTDDFSGVMLPYQENELAAVILLPAEGKSLSQMTESLDGLQAHKTLQSFREELVLLLLPKFEMNTQIDLFEALDIRASQGGAADFSGISEQPVEISGVQQQVSLAVDAEGTTAAAATATQFGTSSVGKTQPKVLQCNRPFLFMVVHQPSLTPLFLSAVKHPTTPGNEQRSAK
jgi:serpin B